MGIKATFSLNQIGSKLPTSESVPSSAVVYVDEWGDLTLYPLEDLYNRIQGAEGTLEDIVGVYQDTLNASEVNLNAVSLVRAYANNAEDDEVEPGLYSAKHWSTKAHNTYLEGEVSIQGHLIDSQALLDNVKVNSDYVDTVYLNTVNDANDLLNQTLDAYRDTNEILTTVEGVGTSVTTKHGEVVLLTDTVSNLHASVVSKEDNVIQLKEDTESLTAQANSANNAAQAAQSATATMRDEVTTLKESAESAASSASEALVSATALSDQVSQDASQVNTDKLAAQAAVSDAQTSATQASNAKIASESVLSDVTGLKADVEDIAATLSSGIKMRGEWDASSGNAPSTPEGDVSEFYKITVAGTINGIDYDVNDNIVYDPTNLTWFKVDNTESVASVNGKKGVVTLTKNDVGLNAVDNTTDLDKPISTATQTALNSKLDADYVPSWNVVTNKPETFTPSVHTHDWTSVTGKPSAFVPSVHGHEWDEITGKPSTATRWPTPNEIGLNNVDNTSDVDKPISSAVQLALNSKLDADYVPNYEEIINTPNLKPVATSGDYNDLSNKPSAGNIGASPVGHLHTYLDVDYNGGYFNVDGSTGSGFENGLYISEVGSNRGSTNAPQYTSVLTAQTANHRSIHLTVDGQGYLWGLRSHSNTGTYTFKSKVKEADKSADSEKLDGLNSTDFARVSHTHDISQILGFIPNNKIRSSEFMRADHLGGSSGTFSTGAHIISGKGSGGVALSINDGGGNANVTFNNLGARPEQNGNSARIVVNTDSTSDASFKFLMASGVTKDAATPLTEVMHLSETEFRYGVHKVWHKGNFDADMVMRIGYRENVMGITQVDGNHNGWVRTPVNGLLPYESGKKSALGSSSWQFATSHIDYGFFYNGIKLDSNRDDKIRLLNADDNWNYLLFTRSDNTSAWEVGVKGGTNNTEFLFRGKDANQQNGRDLLVLDYTDNQIRTPNLRSNELHVTGVAGNTIAGTDFDKGYFKIGSSADGIAMDNNEIYFVNNGMLGTFSGNLNLRPAGNITMLSGKSFYYGEGSIQDGNSGTLVARTNYGYLRMGPNNSEYCHFYTDTPNFYFGRPVFAQNYFKVYNSETYLQSTGSRVGVGAGADIGLAAGQTLETGLEVLQPSSNSDSMITFHIANLHALKFGLCKDRRRLVTGGWSDGDNIRDVQTKGFLYIYGLNTRHTVSYQEMGTDGVIQLRRANGGEIHIDNAGFRVGDTVNIISNYPYSAGFGVSLSAGTIYHTTGSTYGAGDAAPLGSNARMVKAVKIADDAWTVTQI